MPVCACYAALMARDPLQETDSYNQHWSGACLNDHKIKVIAITTHNSFQLIRRNKN